MADRSRPFPVMVSVTPAILVALRAGYVPAACLPSVLEGWVGPVVPPWATRGPLNEGWMLPWFLTRRAGTMEGGDDWALPLSRPEVRLRVAAVLAAGERCNGECSRPPVSSRFVGREPVPGQVYGVTDDGIGIRMFGCRDCGGGPSTAGARGSGYLRQPAPIWHVLPASEVGPGGLPPEDAPHASELIACSVARVLAGMGPVRAILRWVEWGTAGVPVGLCRWNLGTRYGANVGRRPGRKTWIDERPATEARAMAEGYALLDATGLRAPWPEGA